MEAERQFWEAELSEKVMEIATLQETLITARTKISQLEHQVCQRVAVCVAVYCSVLQCVAVCCSVLQCAAVCCSVLQCAAVCCSMSTCVVECCNAL